MDSLQMPAAHVLVEDGYYYVVADHKLCIINPINAVRDLVGKLSEKF